MVSIVLLTTEEVLQRNGFWYCLDTIWITQEMEPFEEVRPEHVYSKPLSRDIYYAKFPDIPRSESEDENSLTVKGFINKHREWKSNICIRKLDSQRNSMQSTLSVKSDSESYNRSISRRVSKKVKPLITEENKTGISKLNIDNDERVRNFFEKLLQSIPPPPVEDFTDVDSSIIQPQVIQAEISDIDLPDYADFENDCILQLNEDRNGPVTSTLKKPYYKTSSSVNSFKTDNSDQFEWYETIYGVSDLIMESRETRDVTSSTHRLTSTVETDDLISWSEIVEMCGLAESVYEKETQDSEYVISHSHFNDGISDISGSDEEDAYTKFACNKLRQSLKNKGGIPDSSSIENLNGENEELIKSHIVQNDPSHYKTFYRLAPDEEDLVNV